MLRQGTATDMLIRWGLFLAVDLLIGYACFLACVTWFDWIGLFTVFLGVLPLWFGRSMYFLQVILLLVWLRAILGSETLSRLHRVALALGIVWLLVLPYIPWSSQKALIMDAARLRQGMSKAQVQAIMATHQGVHDGGGGDVFCADDDWNGSHCPLDGTVVLVTMQDGQLVSVTTDMD